MFSKLLAKKVSLQEKHLTYDIDHIITNITNMFLALNTKLKKKYVFNFVHDIFHAPQFDKTICTDKTICDNQYHNIHHTYEVVQMVACILSNTKLKKILSPFERTILLVVATCHDFGHNGLSNNDWDEGSIKKQKARISSIFSSNSMGEEVEENTLSNSPRNSIICSSTDECLLCGMNVSKSYNELMHFELSMDIVLKHKKKILEDKPDTEILHLLSLMIIETDLRKHEEYMQKEKTSNLDMMILVLKLSDISHIMRPFPVHLYWVYSLVQESRIHHIHHIHRKEVPTVEYMVFDTIRFGKKFVGDMLGIIISIFPDFPPALKANYEANLNIWESYIKKLEIQF